MSLQYFSALSSARQCKLGIRKTACDDWVASPMLAKSFDRLPPTHIITAEFDICRDEAHQYGKLLAKSGNRVTQKCYMGVPHAFGHYTHPEKGLSKGHEYIQDCSRLLRQAHGLCKEDYRNSQEASKKC